jgi:hypothetical protein
MSVLFSFIILKALKAIMPDKILIGIPINNRIDHLLMIKFMGKTQWAINPINKKVKNTIGGGIMPLKYFV